jgi:uncharacterized membrane protein YbhN (UPF0104 family)
MPTAAPEPLRASGSPFQFRWRLRLLALVLTAGLLGLALSRVNLAEVLAALRHLDVWSLAALAGVNLVILVLMCLRWHLILRRLGSPVALARLILYRLGANAISFLTPGPQFGGEPYQILQLTRRHGLAADAAAASVVVDRLMEVAANFLLLAAGGAWILRQGFPEFSPPAGVLAPLGVVPLALGGILAVQSRGRRPLSVLVRGLLKHWTAAPRLEAAARWLAAAEGQAGVALAQPPGVHLAYAGTAALHWLGIAAEIWLVYCFLGAPLGLTPLVTVVVAARLAFLVPVPGGLGALEASQALILPALGLDPALGLAACCLFRARDFLLVGLGAGLGCAAMGGPRRSLAGNGA